MVIVITGVIGGMVAIFIKSPVDSYVDMARRAALTDVADTAVRRMARDIRLALPNSVRNSGAGAGCIEFIPTKIGGRYRTAQTSTMTGDVLDFTAADTSFDMLWLNSALPAPQRLVTGDLVVVYNDNSSSGNAYTASNSSPITGLAEDATAKTTTLTITPKQFPSESPASRFQVVGAAEQMVGFGCVGSTLYRYTHANMSTGGCAAPGALSSGVTANVLAENVSPCTLIYEPPGSGTGVNSRNGIVSISLGITQSGETVSLYHQVHVDNTP